MNDGEIDSCLHDSKSWRFYLKGVDTIKETDFRMFQLRKCPLVYLYQEGTDGRIDHQEYQDGFGNRLDLPLVRQICRTYFSSRMSRV
jgi:hypothetical protein